MATIDDVSERTINETKQRKRIFFQKKMGEPNNETYDPRPSSMTRRTPNRKINKWGKPAGKEKDTAIRIWRNRIKREREREENHRTVDRKKRFASLEIPNGKDSALFLQLFLFFFLVINRWWKDKKTQSRME